MKLIAHLIDYSIVYGPIADGWIMQSYWRFDDDSTLKFVRSHCSIEVVDVETVLVEHERRLIEHQSKILEKEAKGGT